MQERPQPDQQSVRIHVDPHRLDCYLDGSPTKSIVGVKISVELDGQPVWQQIERPRFASWIVGYAPKPFYEKRIEKARKKAEKIAKNLIQ